MVFDLDTEVNVPLILNPGSICQRLIRVWCYVGTQPAPAILLGASTMTNMKAVINLSTHTVHCEALTDAKGNPYQVKLLPRLEPNGPRPLAQLSSDGDDIESFLASLSDDELDEWHEARAATLPDFRLSFPLKDMVPSTLSTTRKYSIPSKLKPSLNAKLDQLQAGGVIRTVDKCTIPPDAVISPGFVKEKKGQVMKAPDGSEIPKVRLLCDFTILNSVIESRLVWNTAVDNINENLHSIPHDSKFFYACDITDAYYQIGLDSSVWRYTYCRFDDEYIFWLRLPQGMSLAAIYFPFALKCQLDLLYKEKGIWRKWWVVYLDDILGHATTRQQATGRLRILRSALRALKLPLSDKVPIEVSTEVDCVGVAVSQAGWSLSSKNRGKLIKALNATPKTAKQLHSLIGVYNYGSTGFVTSKASEVATNLAVLHTAVHTKPFKWTPQCQHAQDFLREHLASSPRAFLAFDDLLTKCKGGPYSLAITVDAADVGIGGHLWMVRQPARATSIHDLANAEIATLISAFSLILDSHQKAWHTFEKESFAIYSAVMRWRSLLIGATRDDTAATYSLDECSIKIFTDSTVAVSRVGKGFDIDLTSSKVTLKAKRFRSWQLEVSEMSYLPICVVHSDGTSNSISDFYSRYTEFLQDSAPSTEHAVVEVGSQQQPLQLGDEISSTLFMAPNEDEDPIDSDADDTSKPGEVVHLCLTQGQAAVIETSYHTDESKYLNVPISLVWKILNDQDHHEFADNLVQRAKAWIAGGKFTRRLTESPHYGMFTQATKRQQDLRDLPWVLVIPSTAIFYEENLINHCYDPQQEATSARDSLMAYVHDGRWHLKYVAALELLFSICWWPSMAVDLKEYIEDCDYCSRTAKQASLPYRGVLSGDQRFDIVCMDHKNLPGRAGLTFTKVLTLTCPASGSTRFVPQRVADAAQTALDLYVSWVALCGWPRQVVTDGASNFCSRLSERLYALGGIRHRTALTAAPTGNAVVERRHKILGEVLNWYDSTCGIQTDDDVRMALAAAEQRINHVPDSKGTTVYARMFGIPPNWGPLQRPTRLENNQQPPNDDDLIKAINDITNHLTKDFNLRRDAKAKQNELRVCNVTDDTKYNNNRLSSASIGDKVWIQANQQAAITNIYYDSQGRARAIEAGGSLWNPRDISLVRRDLINSIPAAPMFRSDSI